MFSSSFTSKGFNYSLCANPSNCAFPTHLGTGRLQKNSVHASGIRFFLVCQTCKIVHAGIQGKSDPFALFKGVVAFSVFDFRVIALINAGQVLHFDLGISPFDS